MKFIAGIGMLEARSYLANSLLELLVCWPRLNYQSVLTIGWTGALPV